MPSGWGAAPPRTCASAGGRLRRRRRWRSGSWTRSTTTPAEAALAYAREHLLPKSASSLRLAVRALRAGFAQRFRNDLAEVERLYLEELMSTADANEGLTAFLEKRKPSWSDT